MDEASIGRHLPAIAEAAEQALEIEHASKFGADALRRASEAAGEPDMPVSSSSQTYRVQPRLQQSAQQHLELLDLAQDLGLQWGGNGRPSPVLSISSRSRRLLRNGL